SSQVLDAGGPRGDDDVAARYIRPVVLPGSQYWRDVAHAQKAGVRCKRVEHPLAVIEAVDGLQAAGERQTDRARTAADVQQGVAAGQVHPADELLRIAALQRAATDVFCAPVPGAGRLGRTGCRRQVLAIEAPEVDRSDSDSAAIAPCAHLAAPDPSGAPRASLRGST